MFKTPVNNGERRWASWVQGVVARGGACDGGVRRPLMMKFQDVGRLRAASLLVVSVFRNEQQKYVEQRRKTSVLTENRDGAAGAAGVVATTVWQTQWALLR
ncbi:hypothetical protein NL676_024856 [Syzygium grande]|nr:hypothetical protein NL676_024856 [Syzygium grande]